MTQSITELDHKGVLPRVGENENQFYERGNRFLDTAYEFKAKRKNQIGEPYELDDFQTHFLTYPDWVSCSYAKLNSRGGRITGGTTSVKRYKNQGIPIVSVNEILSYELFNHSYKEIFRHELIHSVRTSLERHKTVKFYSPFFMNKIGPTYEAFAYSLDFEGRYPLTKSLNETGDYVILFASFSYSTFNFFKGDIFTGFETGFFGLLYLNSFLNREKSFSDSKKMYHILEDIRKKEHSDSNPKVNYALLRMTNSEVLDFNEFKDSGNKSIEDFIKSKSVEDLRFRIMAERLG